MTEDHNGPQSVTDDFDRIDLAEMSGRMSPRRSDKDDKEDDHETRPTRNQKRLCEGA